MKNKQGVNKLASLIKKAGFDDVKVTVGSKSITLTPTHVVDLRAGLSDLKKGNYKSFKSAADAVKFLSARSKKTGKSVSKKR
ncbi:MAG: hypothetical protein ABI539_11620 [Acidobacteriota bacterium]